MPRPVYDEDDDSLGACWDLLHPPRCQFCREASPKPNEWLCEVCDPPPPVYVEGSCEGCGTLEGVAPAPCWTQYADETKNREPLLCPDCTEHHNELWEAQWAEYNAGRL